MKRKYMALFLAAVLCFGFAGCGKSNETPTAEVTVWTVQPTEKILSDLTYSAQETAGRTMEIYAYRNDYEAGQIILTPSADVGSYDIELYDLHSAEGNTLPASDFTVYNQKYYEIDEHTRNTNGELGLYPDALLPFETAKAYGENTIEAGRNQGIWITLKTSDTQAAGVYTGSFTVTCDGTEYAVPVSVTVWDAAVSEETHTRSMYGVDAYWSMGGASWATMANGEKDDSYEMLEKYGEALLQHRLSPGYFGADPQVPDKYAAAMFEAALDPRCTTIRIPPRTTWEYFESLNTLEVGQDWIFYEEVLNAMAQECIDYYEETGTKVNIFKKSITYFTQTDEAYVGGRMYRPNKIFAEVFDVQEEIAAKWISGTLTCSDPTFVAELAAEMLEMPQLFVDRYNDELTAEGVTWCPTIDRYNTEYERMLYAADNPDEKWWYTCNNPQTPYPTLHVDDPQQMLSSRIMGWMQFDYDVVGTLYWNTTYYVKASAGSATDLTELEDFYAGGRREAIANGDGYLFFPGAPYGIDGPVSTIRLESLRDGLEEYEVMYAYEQRALAADSAADVRAVLEYLYENLYTGTKVSTDTETFLSARKSLAELAVAAEKGVAVTDVRVEDGKQIFTVYAPSDAAVTANGNTLEGAVVGANKRYEIEAVREDGTNVLTFTAGDVSVTLDLGGDEVQYGADSLVEGAELHDAEGAAVDAFPETGVAGSVYRLTATGEDPYVTLTGDFFTGIDSDMTWVKLYIYAEADTQIQLMTRYARQSVYSLYSETMLAQGLNELIINTRSMDLSSLGSLQAVRLRIQPESVVYIVKGVVKQ